ncbi:MAG: permease, partial [Thiomicrorhabdus sp.]|nr:permease [Thiomicrorhabdus sp.]
MFEKIGNYAAFNLLALDPDSSLGAAVQFFVMDIIKILVLLVVIIYLMGLLRAYISPERVRKVIQGKPKWFARLMAILLGSVTPFCSCSSVPLFIGFVEAGIPMGVTFSFLIASPMINEIAVVMLASILGWEIALMYVGAGLVVAYVGGMIMERFKTERWVESYVWKIQMGETDNTQKKQTLTQRHEYALNEVKTIVLRIWKWIFIGIAIGAAFHGYVPQQWVT